MIILRQTSEEVSILILVSLTETTAFVFSFKKVNRRSAIIHVFTKTPPNQRSRKVVRFMQNEREFILYRAQRTNVNI